MSVCGTESADSREYAVNKMQLYSQSRMIHTGIFVQDGDGYEFHYPSETVIVQCTTLLLVVL